MNAFTFIKKMEKRGQVTIFIIIAIVIIVAGFLVFMFYPQLRGGFTSETDNINVFVEECIRDSGINVIYEVGKTGGYFFIPELSTSTGIPYYYHGGKNYMPSKEEIETQISFYISQKLFFCTKNFVDFKDFEIISGDIKIKTRIFDNKVILDVEYPLRIKKGESISLLKNFKNIEIPVRLGIVYNSVFEIMEKQVGRQDICLSCILELSLENDLYIEMMDFDEETTIFIFRDENSELNNNFFELRFANKYIR